MSMIKLDRLVFPDTPAARERYEAPRSVDELRSRMGQAASLLDILDRPQTAYEDLQGIEPGAGDQPWFEEFLEENSEGTIEIQRAFEQFNLPELTLERIREMNGAERTRLANHFVYFVESTKYRAGVLGAEGVDYQKQFASYGFKSEEEIHHYSRVLFKMIRSIEEQPFYEYLEEQAARSPQGNRAQLTRMQHVVNNEKSRHGGRSPFVYTDTDRSGRLKIWYQATDDK